MDSELARFDNEWKQGDRDVARATAKEYVAAHPELAPTLETYSLEGLVQLVDGYREAGREEDRIIADIWLLAKYPPQHISGVMNVGGAPAVAQAVSDALSGGNQP